MNRPKVTGMPSYSCYDLAIRSAMELPEAVCGGDTECDVEIRQGDVVQQLDCADCLGALFQAKRDAFLLDVPGVARLLVSDGCRVTINRGEFPVAARQLLYGPAMAALLMQRGFTVLQASAVRTSQGALLLLGPPRAGKSRLAMAFHQAGFPLLADDLCTFSPGSSELVTGPRFACLWGDDLNLAGSAAKRAQQLRPQVNRHLVPLVDPVPAALPVHALCVLDSWNEERTAVTPLGAPGRSTALLGNAYHRPLLESCFTPPERLRAVTLLGKVPAYHLWHSRTVWDAQQAMSDICTAINLNPA